MEQERGGRQTLRDAAYLLWILVPLVGLFFQGLFYAREYLLALAVLFPLGALLFWLRGSGPRWGWEHLGLWLLPLGYLLPFLTGPVTRGPALYGLLLVAAFPLAYRVGQWMRLGSRLGVLPLHGTFWALVLVCLAGAGAVTGYLHHPSYLTGSMLDSTLQYHNAFAAVMGLGVLLGLGLLLGTRTPWGQAAVLTGLVLVEGGWMLSQSRGVFVLLPLALLVLGILLRPGERTRYLWGVLITWPASALGIGLMHHMLNTGHPLRALLVFPAAAVAGGVLGAVALLLTGRAQRAMAWIGGGVLLLALVAGGAEAFLHRHHLLLILGHLLPSTLVQRVGRITLQSVNLQARFDLWRIALILIGKNPLLGYGAGAWQNLYHTYQSQYVIANLTHQFYLQTWIEGGILAIGGLLLWLAGMVKCLIRDRQTRSVTENGALVAAGLVLVHSAMDFDMSYASIAVLVFLLLGWATGAYGPAFTLMGRISALSIPTRQRGLILWPTMVAVVACVSLGYGLLLEHQANNLAKAGNLRAAAAAFQQAKTLDPLDGRIVARLAMVRYQLGEPPSRVAPLLQDSLSLSPDNVNHLLEAAELAQATSDSQRAYSLAHRVLDLTIFRPAAYYLVAESALALGAEDLAHGQRAQGTAYLRQVGQAVQEYDAARTRLWIRPGALLSPRGERVALGQAEGEADFYLGHYHHALPLLLAADGEATLRLSVDPFLYVTAEKLGDQTLLTHLQQRVWVKWYSTNPQVQELKRLAGI